MRSRFLRSFLDLRSSGRPTQTARPTDVAAASVLGRHAAIAITAVVLAACGGTASDDAASEPEPASTSSEATTTTAATTTSSSTTIATTTTTSSTTTTMATATTTTEAATSTTEADAEVRDVFSLAVGDCFDDPDAFGDIQELPFVPCDEPHDNEAYHAFDLGGGEYPGDDAMDDLVFDACIDAFETYVGTTYADSRLDVSYLAPTQESWDLGDREIVCILYDLTFAKLEYSMAGTGE